MMGSCKCTYEYGLYWDNTYQGKHHQGGTVIGKYGKAKSKIIAIDQGLT